jgi:hypothetical protein
MKGHAKQFTVTYNWAKLLRVQLKYLLMSAEWVLYPWSRLQFFTPNSVGVFVLYSSTSCMKFRCQYFLLDCYVTLNRVVSEASTGLLL